MGVKVKKKKSKAEEVKVEKKEGEELPPAGMKVDPDDVTYAGEGDQLYYVTLEKAGHAAVVYGESAGDAKDAFLKLFGIVGTEHPIKAAKVDDDHGYNLDKFGVVVPTPKKKKRRSDQEGDDRDDD